MHGYLFLWYFELFWHSLKVGQTKAENMHFFRHSRNWNLKLDVGTHLRDKPTCNFLGIVIDFGPQSNLVKPRPKTLHFFIFLKSNFKLDFLGIWEISMGTYFYDISSYFGHLSRLVKPRLKICSFVDFLRIEILK